jgi:IclR family acetate operon transcriptional repressor
MPDHYIQLVGKIVRVAEVLREEPNGLSLQELAARTGYVKSSIHRILRSLKKHGYIEQGGVGENYRLGIQFLVLASGLAARTDLVNFAHPYLRELVERFNESAYLAVLRAGRGIFVEVQEAHRDFRLIGPLGAEVHFHATAAGKAMAAYLSPERRAELLRSMPRSAITKYTLTDPARIEQDWSEIRQRGFATNDEETILGAAFLAAPVFDSRESVCGSLTVGLPKARCSTRLEKQIAGRIRDACHRLSNELRATGYVHVAGN